jgi:outer membrane biosynthesis protein TonB
LPAAVVTPAAAGAFRALAGLLAGGVGVMLALAVALLVSGGNSLTLHAGTAALLSLGFACVSTATIVALADGLRAPTLALVFAIATFWTAAAFPLWVAIPATLITGLVLAADTRAGGSAQIGGRVPVAALAVTGALLLIVTAATAEPRHASRPVTPPAGTQPHHAAPVQPATPAPVQTTTPAPVQTTTPAPVQPATPAPVQTATPAAPADAATPSKPDATPTATPAGNDGEAPAPDVTPTAPSHDAKPDATPAAPAARPAPADFVRTYYAALDDRRFADAWKLLSPAVRTHFGTFAHWRAGYATTLASSPEDVKVVPAADGSATVRHVLVARDRTKCGGTVERRFAVTWKLAPAASGWTVANLSATASGPVTKSALCG